MDKKEYRNPSLACDLIVEIDGKIVLIERKNPPHGWALPGGFIDYGESAEAAAIREAKEEISLDVTLEALLSVYSDPQRDPRQHVASVVFLAKATGHPRAADDAKTVLLVSPEELPSPLCFDHAQILQDYRHFRKTGEHPKPRR